MLLVIQSAVTIPTTEDSQKTRHGSAAHLLQPERRTPSTIAIHSGDVCTMCRMTPDDTAPTTSRAAMIATQQPVRRRANGWELSFMGTSRCHCSDTCKATPGFPVP